VLTGHLILDTIQSNTTQNHIDQDTLDKAQQALGVFDVGIVFVNASFYLASFIFVYQIRSNPIYFVPSFIFLTISVWLSAEIANMYNLIANVSVMQSAANAFPTLNLFYTNLPLITAVLGFGVLIMLYGKTRSGSEVQV
jgi:glucan phosphoethanolaminetransferase (alkaline phosphatase superfamily)